MLTMGPGIATVGQAIDEPAPDAIMVNENSFRCIRKMVPVRHFYIDNLLGNTAGTLEAANAPNGAVYPPGSVVQLVPTEAMGKREPGFSPATGDWEFFELEVSEREVSSSVVVGVSAGSDCLGAASSPILFAVGPRHQ